jgi:hypothetical protein
MEPGTVSQWISVILMAILVGAMASALFRFIFP